MLGGKTDNSREKADITTALNHTAAAMGKKHFGEMSSAELEKSLYGHRVRRNIEAARKDPTWGQWARGITGDSRLNSKNLADWYPTHKDRFGNVVLQSGEKVPQRAFTGAKQNMLKANDPGDAMLTDILSKLQTK
jgi:hypothetical protein